MIDRFSLRPANPQMPGCMYYNYTRIHMHMHMYMCMYMYMKVVEPRCRALQNLVP
jgi:hypothetical protein